MTYFRILLVAMLVAIVVYTAVTISNHGLDLFTVFFTDIAKMEWPGQFNFDFMLMLVLSGTWVAWRGNFKPKALLLSIPAFLGGILFLSIYLLWLTFKTNGDMKLLLLGTERATR